MEKEKKERLEKKGWKVGDIDDFLQLDKTELAIIEMKVALAKAVVKKRKKAKISQTNVAKMIGSSQPRVVKIEQGDKNVSFELLLKTFLALGATKKEIAKAICV